MEESYEYQIYIGCKDPQLREELIKEHELREMVSRFFESRKLDFSLLSLKGGYLYEDGWYDTEDTVCISIVGDTGLDIIKIAKSLSAYMNQKCFLIVRNPLKKTFC